MILTREQIPIGLVPVIYRHSAFGAEKQNLRCVPEILPETHLGLSPEVVTSVDEPPSLEDINPVRKGGVCDPEKTSSIVVYQIADWHGFDTMPADVVAQFDTTEEPHRMYIGEVVKIL